MVEALRKSIITNDEISNVQRRREKTSSLAKYITDSIHAMVTFAASLATAFAICSATTITTIIFSLLKSLIDLFTIRKSVPSPPSKAGTFFPSLVKPVLKFSSYPCSAESVIAPSSPAREKALLPVSSKKTLFLGLRRVLVRFTVNPPPDHFDFVVYPRIKGKTRACYVLKRPGLDELLHAAKNAAFEVVIYTSGLSEYAGPIIDMLDPTRELITHRLYKSACTTHGDASSVKDLVTTGRQLDRSLIIDDNPKKHVKQCANAIAVRPFLGDHTDTDLINLLKFFEVERNFNDLCQLIQLKKLGVTPLTVKDSEEFGMAACRLSLLQSLEVSSDFTGFAYAQLCLDFQSSPPPLLQNPKLIGPLEKLPYWIHFPNNLVKISLKDSKIPENAIQVLQRLPTLTALSLLHKFYHERDLKFHGSTFPKLAILNLACQGNLSAVTFEEQCMPELEELSVTSTNSNFIITGIGSLLKLKEVKVYCGEEESALQDTVQRQVDAHINCPTLEFTHQSSV